MAESGVSSVANVIDYVTTFVRDRFAETGRGVNGAVLAEKVRREFPEFDPKRWFGDHWVVEVVRIAERDGKLTRDRMVKHLEVLPPGQEPRTRRPLSMGGSGQEYVHVHPKLWRAAIYPNHPPCYFHRESQQVFPLPLPEGQEAEDFVKIEPIPVGEQQEWMREFVRSHSGLSLDHAPITVESWWVKFPDWLRQTSSELEARWKKIRTLRVVEHVRDWAIQNRIPVQMVLTAPTKVAHSGVSTHSLQETDHIHETTEDSRTRSAILAAICDMTLDEIKELTIPVRYVLRYFQPR